MKNRKQGSVLMEAALIMPVLLMLIFYFIQLTFVLMARQMTYYAAYCAARSMMVTHPEDRRSQAQRAAETVLAWIAWAPATSDSRDAECRTLPLLGNGRYTLPRTQALHRQVAVQPLVLKKGPGAKGMWAPVADVRRNGSDESPYVGARVTFYCPLMIPLGGLLFASEWVPPADAGGPLTDMRESRAGRMGREQTGFRALPITETCVLSLPYSTETFPRLPGGTP